MPARHKPPPQHHLPHGPLPCARRKGINLGHEVAGAPGSPELLASRAALHTAIAASWAPPTDLWLSQARLMRSKRPNLLPNLTCGDM